MIQGYSYVEFLFQQLFIERLSTMFFLEDFIYEEPSVFVAAIQFIEPIIACVDEFNVVSPNKYVIMGVWSKECRRPYHIDALKLSKDTTFFLHLHLVKILVRHILCVISALMFTCTLSAQDRSALDAELSRYEALCQECLELKSRIASGEKIPRVMAEEMIGRFVSMNASLKECRGDMTVVQRKRFDAVGVWFTTGERPQIDLGVALEPVLWSFTPYVTSEAPSDISIRYVPPVGVPPRKWDLMSKYVLADFSCPDLSYGLMLGLQGLHWGGYVRARSNFHKLPSVSYTCMSDGDLSTGGRFWASGASVYSCLSLTAGALVPVKNNLTIYAGAGYGSNSFVWEDVNGLWALVSDLSHKGVAADLGVIFSLRRLALHAGITTISFKTAAFTCGVGVRL